MCCWGVVERLPSMNVFPTTWALKLTRYPDGSVRKYKARFCAIGHRQIDCEGVDFFETVVLYYRSSRVEHLFIYHLEPVLLQDDAGKVENQMTTLTT
jgi:hypothetical protein